MLLRFGELAVASVRVHHLLHKSGVGGLREPALLIQQGKNTWRIILERGNREVWHENYTKMLNAKFSHKNGINYLYRLHAMHV